MPTSSEQDCALITAVYQVNDEHGYEIDEPFDLANDLLQKLHALGYYIAPCKKVTLNPDKRG